MYVNHTVGLTPVINGENGSVVDHTALLLRLSRMFNSSLDLDEVLNCVMDEVVRTLHAERGFIMLQEPGEEFQFKVARGIHQEAIPDPLSEISLGIAHQVASNGLPILTSNALADDRFNQRKSVIFLRLRSILCVPLFIKGRIIGVVYVDNRLANGVFTRQDLELLSAIASTAAIAIENARLYQIAIEKGRLESELQIARQVQSSLLPKEIPTCPGWEFSALWQPARQVAGDFYDFIRLGQGQLGLLIADVTDKGVPAALFMALTHTILRASLRKLSSAAADLKRANRLICAESTAGYFVTVFYAGLDLKSGQMTYVNAGHPPPFWCRHREKLDMIPLVHTGMALGIDSSASFDQQTIQLEPGDFILSYTDGVTEAFNGRQEMYGENRLQSDVANNYTLKPAKILEAVLRSVTAWSANPEYIDDITLLIANRF
jgi:sigma-B regulation protein RsbU (phosphoserine phosphatase)